MEDYSGYFRQGDLIAKYLKGELSHPEREELADWIAQSEHNRALFEKLTEKDTLGQELDRFGPGDKEAAWERIAAETGHTQTARTTYIGTRLGQLVAAALVIVISGLLVYQVVYKDTPTQPVAQQLNDILPGGNKAVLTLADASQINLDDATNGEIARQSDMVITKTADGQLVYDLSKATAASSSQRVPVVAYNTITTPRGGKFRVILPDGSKVWLNAASSLKYPTKFLSHERQVELNGEAYFEITHVKTSPNVARPFRVCSEGQVVEVLGTHFNINSYSDEKSVKTTLLEGKVKVIKTLANVSSNRPNGKTASALILKPGEQAQLASGNRPNLNLIAQADLEEAVAWKNGQFHFKDTDLPTIMRQIARWYDVKVGYQGKIPDMKFRGRISRDVPLSQIFQILQLSGVNFKLDGRKITVKS
ncbi:FecR family protein [Spirosoma endophyticum]|uniref:FecR family protein n=1 Tax=Spirosoma endophyticum TaxID=662367 RepID=A0A1I1EZJ5_9BACT|nr:FecR domain-containing protein [Spirosoma endophyticum]SFB90333.1 FecR family protein [Spirosoma endophyticum]